MIHLPASGQQATSGWLATILNIAVRESGSARAGSENILSRLSELMFVEAIRRYIEALPRASTGWLVGLRDPVVGQALAVLHAEPADGWTVESLARRVGVSRSVLAERFTELAGHPPMHYLALVAHAARVAAPRRRRPVAAVAGAVGYESEAAFSRAFKKLVGGGAGLVASRRHGRRSRPDRRASRCSASARARPALANTHLLM